jgi:hypothetical protein
MDNRELFVRLDPRLLGEVGDLIYSVTLFIATIDNSRNSLTV